MKTRRTLICGIAIMAFALIFAGCQKPDEPNNGDDINGGDNNEGGATHAYVDLGLPSGLLWATCNIGAETPEGYGYYFAWGETETKASYDWNTYQWSNGRYDELTKYCQAPSYGYNGFTDNLTFLEESDDAANAFWGRGWRMPTQADWEELCSNTDYGYTIQNGVAGRYFKGSNGNSIFLPMSGDRWKERLEGADVYGCYWSSTLVYDLAPTSAYRLFINAGACGVYSGARMRGCVVRAVRATPYN